MRDFWKRRRDRAEWPKARPEFLSSLADDIRETRSQARFGKFRLALVLAVLTALLLPLAAYADRSPGERTRETIKAVVSYLQANTVGRPSDPRRDDDDDDDGGGGPGGGGGGGGGGDDDDDDDDDDYPGGPGDDDDDGGGDDDDNGGGDDDDDDDYPGEDDDDDDGGGGDDDDDGGGGGGDDDDD